MIFVLGGEGFVGSAYVRLLQSFDLAVRPITRANYDAMRGAACDILINANGNSQKFFSTREPLKDFDLSVRSVAASLEDFRAERYVFLSSGDVYPETASAADTDEDQIIDVSRVSRYGLHKYLAEQLAQAVHKRWLVVRMGGFVGLGIKKNAIYDILTGREVWLAPDSELQYIDTLAAAKVVWSLIEAGLEKAIVNLGGDGLQNIGRLHREVGSASVFRPEAPVVRYELSLRKLQSLVEAPLPRTQECVSAFVAGVLDSRIPLV